MRSDLIKKGPTRAPHRSLIKAMGITESEMKKPFVAVVSAKSDYIPGHKHLDDIAEEVKAGIRNAGASGWHPRWRSANSRPIAC